MTAEQNTHPVKPRYAVLWDLDLGDDAQPRLLAYDAPDGVHIVGAHDYGLKSLLDGPYEETLPDGSADVKRPGDDGFFERALGSLFYSFAITIPSAEREALWEIVGSHKAGPVARRIAGLALGLPSPGAIHTRNVA